MARECRVRVVFDNADPFWVFVNIKKSPLIADIQQKITQLYEHIDIECLSLDGCILPLNESSKLLRDNDIVNVHARTSKTSSNLSTTTRCQDAKPVKKERKFKKPQEKKIKSEKLKKKCMEKAKKKCPEKSKEKFPEESKEKCSEKPKKKCLATLEKPDDKVKVKENRKRKKEVEVEKTGEASVDETSHVKCSTLVDNLPENGQILRKKRKKIKDGIHKETNSQDPAPPSDSLSSELAASQNDVCGINHQTSSTFTAQEGAETIEFDQKKIRRKRARKKKHVVETPLGHKNVTSHSHIQNGPPAPLRLPRWQQSQNKRIKFSSDEDSETGEVAEENKTRETADNAIGSRCSKGFNEKNRTQGIKDSAFDSGCQNAFDEESRTEQIIASTSGNSCSNGVNESPMSFNTPLGSNAVQVNKTLPSNNDAPIESEERTGGMIVEAGEGSTEAWGENGWSGTQQHPGQLDNEKITHWKVDRSAAPLHNNYADQPNSYDKFAIPDVAAHLKMSPGDRGAKMHPNVMAKRLPNGAMMYSRNPVGAFHRRIDQYTTQKAERTEHSAYAYYYDYNFPHGDHKTQREVKQERLNKTESDFKGKGCNVEKTVEPCPQRDYSSFPDLIAAPKVGDHIAYKVLEMDENYTPGISGFKEADVLAYDASSQLVTVKLQPGSQEKEKKIPGKFSIPELEKENETEEVVTVELSSMFEPKLISSN